jgi:heme o synthase
MFLIIFVWTPPHFWALSLVLKGDYARAGVPMLPVVRGEHATRTQIVLYAVVLLVTSLTLVATQAMGRLYLLSALTLGVGLCIFAARLALSRSVADARAFFWLSNNYLALLFAAMVLDRLMIH